MKQGPACGIVTVEGPKLIGEALRAGWQPSEIWSVSQPAFEAGCPTYLLSKGMYQTLSPARSGQEPLAFFERPDFEAADTLSRGRFLLLDGIQDPGNAGGLVRAAAAFDFDGVLWREPSVSPFHYACIRASAGCVFHMCHYLADVDMLRGPLPLIGSDAEAPNTLEEYCWPRDLILAMGNEGRGLSDDVCARLTAAVRIPIAPLAESLNVAGAAHILMYQLSRRRPTSDSGP